MSSQEIVSAGRITIDFTKAFASLTLFRSGPRLQKDTLLPEQLYSAKFKIDCNMAVLFPYINAAVAGAHYCRQPEYIKFVLDEQLCILYSHEGAFSPVADHNDAVDFLRKISEVISNIHSRIDEITPDFRPYNSVSPLDIYRLLPGSNCRECGYRTCLAFAAALSRQLTSQIKCPHLPKPIEEKSTFQVMDNQGRHTQTISLAINTDCLQKEISRKESHIQRLEARLATFEQSRTESIEANNGMLLSPLTSREIEVLEMVAHGATNKEISKNMHISEHTVKTHITHIFDKLEVNDRAQASVWAAKNGLL